MTKKQTPKPLPTRASNKKSKPPFVVFGIDPNGKAKGARFNADQSELADKARALMKLEFFEAATDEMQELAKKLPSGRIYARGRAFVPFIKRELYDRLHATFG